MFVSDVFSQDIEKFQQPKVFTHAHDTKKT